MRRGLESLAQRIGVPCAEDYATIRNDYRRYPFVAARSSLRAITFVSTPLRSVPTHIHRPYSVCRPHPRSSPFRLSSTSVVVHIRLSSPPHPDDRTHRGASVHCVVAIPHIAARSSPFRMSSRGSPISIIYSLLSIIYVSPLYLLTSLKIRPNSNKIHIT
jgi:hypothetical protein